MKPPKKAFADGIDDGARGPSRGMAAHAIIPPPHRRWAARVAAIVATAALLGCGVAIAVMVIPSADEEVAATAPPPAAEQPAAEAPAKPTLTARNALSGARLSRRSPRRASNRYG